MKNESQPVSDLILYQTEDGRTRIQCRFEDDTIWLTQKLMAELFQKDVRTINEHLVNIFEDGRLVTSVACESAEEAADLARVWEENEGVRCEIEDLSVRHAMAAKKIVQHAPAAHAVLSAQSAGRIIHAAVDHFGIGE